MEEKIFFGTLGTLKIRSREEWQKAIQDGNYDKQCETLTWGGKSVQDTPFESRMESAEPTRPSSPSPTDDPSQMNGDAENKRDSTGSNAAAVALRKQTKRIRDLASAILQVAQMVDHKYLKAPLGEDEKEKKKRLKEEEKKKKVCCKKCSCFE